ncbi:MAG TPA: hypothetical protein VGP06_16945, partial [Janthinobacterium sp.]|nr:hypothetical protein [Janthinobacterium sp.]
RLSGCGERKARQNDQFVISLAKSMDESLDNIHKTNACAALRRHVKKRRTGFYRDAGRGIR